MASKRLLIASWVMLVIVTGASGEAAHEGLVDPAMLAATLDLTEGGVRRWLDRLGVSGDGSPTERLLAVSLTGQLVEERHGGSSLVHIDSELDTTLRQPEMSVVLVHNHPANAGLSAADTQQLAKPGVAAIVAVGHDGSVFIASAGPRLNARLVRGAAVCTRPGRGQEEAARRMALGPCLGRRQRRALQSPRDAGISQSQHRSVPGSASVAPAANRMKGRGLSSARSWLARRRS